MKKTGFTLAEVLITLAIIGVVATMTLPSLMTNTQEQQAKTGLKKGINTLTEAAQTNQAIDGFDYAGLKDASEGTDTEAQSLSALLINRTQVDFQLSKLGEATGASNAVDDTATNYVVFFRDGSAVSFPRESQATTDILEIQADGLPKGFGVVYDYNGQKKPNLLSNCSGNVVASANSPEFADETDIATCNNKSNRVIKDQFGIKLRGGNAFPNGAAARWAFIN